MTLDLRQLRSVVEIAEQGSFSRAAARLGIAQPTLSQRILELERELGIDLFERHPRGASLTEAGRVFSADARATLAAFDATLERAGRFARGEAGTLDVGFTTTAALELTPLILAAHAECCPEVDVRLREFPLTDPSAGLADGSSDVAFVRPPLGAPGLWLETLLEEPRAVAVADAHPLSGRSSVSVRELLDEPMIATPGGDPVWEDFWLLGEYRDGVPAPIGAHADTHEAELQMIAAGRAISITCASTVRYVARPGVSVVPVRDIAPSQIALGCRAGDANPLVHRFLSVAREVRDGRQEVAGAPRA